MAGTDVPEVTRRCVVSNGIQTDAEMSKVKPVVLAHEHDPIEENLRGCHERDD
jgi:hypothetical protein